MPASAMKSTQHKKEPDRTGRTRPFFSGEAQVQTKLKVGRPGDRFEQEADRAADGVVHGRGPLADGSAIAGRLTPTAQRTPEDDEAQASPMDREAREPIIDELQLQEDQEAQAQSETEEEEIQAQSTTEGEELQTRADSEEEEEIQAQAEEEEELQAQAEAGEEEEIQAQAEAEEEEVQTQEEEVQARATQASSTQAAGQRRTQRMAFVQRRLRAARGLGNPLPEETRRRMQNRFGADLSGIRIHTDALAVELSKALRAQAFAHGRDIYFNANKFQPGTPEGEHLLAHEIAHTIQQGSVKQQVVQLQPDDSDVMMVRPEALEAIRLARAEEGLVNTKLTDAEGNRVGWERLLTYFRTAFGGDTIHPSVIQKITLIPDPAGGPEKVDALPHWCGIFAWWALKSAGVPLPDWKIGMSILEHVEPRPPGSLPQKGDIAYRRKNDHFALVSGLESVADAAGKPVKDVQVRTINGNTAGSDNLGGQVQEKWGPVGEWLTFFDPMAKVKLPEVPLVETTRAPEDLGPAVPETEVEKQAVTSQPTDVSALEGDVAPTAEAQPGTAAEVGLELPPPAPIPPAEPIAKVEKASLEGSTDEAMASFTGASPSAVAATGPDLAAALDQKIAAEQAQAAESAPELKAQTGGDVDPGITPADEIPVPAGTDVGDGIAGASPGELQAEPHRDNAPPPTNQETEKLMDRQPEGGFLAWLRNSIGNLMNRIPTSDPGVSTSAGPRENVALEGDSDPGRMDRQKEDGASQLRAQRDIQTQAFRNHPGQSNIKPRRIDEARKPQMQTEPAARPEPIPPAQGAADYVEAEYPKEVRDKADTDLKPKLEPGLKQADAETAAAAKTRDTESAREKESAAAKARQINLDADSQQKQAVLDGRKDVARQQGEGVAGAYEQVNQFSSDAAKEQTAKRKAVGDHVKTEEGKARKQLEDGEKKAETKKKEEEKKAADKKKELEREQKKESWWDRVASAVKKAVKAVTEAIDTIFTKLREAVKTIIEKAKKAAVALINKARNWVVARLNDFREWAKSQVNKYLKDAFPALAKRINAGIDATVDVAIKGVNTAADAAIAGVEALASALAKALDKILQVFQTALKAAVQIAGAVLTGDFAEALRIALQAACDIAGIDSKPIFGFLDRAGSLIASILKAPLKFINNLMAGVGQGIRNFGQNILVHLQKGLIAWLTGAISQAGLQLPDKFDLPGIFSLVAQILGLTYENVKARVIKKYPKAAKVFATVEKGFALVMKLKKLDFSGLWQEVKDRLSGLKEMVVGGIKEWVVTKVIKEGIIWLLSLMNPASAIVKALKLLFDLVMWLVERFNQIKEFVLSVYDAVAKIAAGVIGPAAKAVEDALSRALPVVISLIASVIGLGGIGKAVKKLLQKITAPINKVIDKVIDKIVGFAKKLLGKAKAGVKKAKEAIKKFFWPKKKFSVEEESHTLYFTKGGDPMIRSTPTALASFIKSWEQTAGQHMSAQKKAALQTAKKTLAEIRTLSAAIEAKRRAGEPVSAPQQQKMLKLQTTMSKNLKTMLGKKSALAKGKERYKLEGLAGTYATIPKPSGDFLTGDHQPQAATFKVLRKKKYFQVKQGQALQERAAGKHAQNAYVINLSAIRHEAGRTYGSKGKSTKATFVTKIQAMEKAEPSQPKRRVEAVKILKGELQADVSAMRSVYARTYSDPIWKDLDPFVSGDPDVKKGLVQQIRTQVSRGQTVIASQPMRELAG